MLTFLYISYYPLYLTAMTAMINFPKSDPFADWEYVPSTIRCWTQGIDVYVENTCYGEDVFNYSPLWLRLTFIRFAGGWTNLFCLSFPVLFFLSLASLPPPRMARFDFVISLFSTISSATAFAVERANADLIMFLMIIVGVLACGSRLPVRLAGYALITVTGLLKFYPMAALILAIRERRAIFITLALAVTTALGGLVLSYRDEIVWAVHNLPTGYFFHPNQFAAKDVPSGLGVTTSKVATKLFHQDATGAEAIGRLVRNSLLLLLIVAALATAIWFSRRCRLRYGVAQLDAPEANFLLAGAALICGCFFAGENWLYKGIFLLLAVPGLLALSHQSPWRLARVAFRGTCVAIVFVLWFPFVQACIRFAVAGLSKPVNMTDEALTRLDRLVRGVMWLFDQLVWWWIIIVLLAALSAFVLNSELWAALFRVLPLPPRAIRWISN
jgi:hypothetical protein